MDQSPPPLNGAYAEDEINLKEIWNLLIRNWLLIGATTGIVAGGAAAYAFGAVPVWESVTSIRIDEDQTNLPILDILSSLSGGSEVQTEMEVLRSRTLVEDVVDSLQLQVRLVRPRGVARGAVITDLSVQREAPEGTYTLSPRGDGVFEIFDEETGGSLGMVSAGEPVSLPGAAFRITGDLDEDREIQISVVEFDRAVAVLQGAVTVARPNREAGIVTVRYQSADTLLVHQVPNRLAASFIANRHRVQRTGARSTVTFLEEQIDTLAGQLRAAENTLVQFREEAGVVSIEAEATAQVTQLTRIQADRMVLNAERAALQTLMDEVEREAANADPEEASPYRRLISFPSLLGNQAASEMLRTLNEIENRRSELLQRRTMEDPDIRNLTGRIHDIEHQLELIGTTYLQGLADHVVALDRTLERFRVELESIPEKEIQFIRLSRQAEILSGLFTLLQTRLQEVRIAEAVEDASVRVVDPAILSSEPVKPRKRLTVLLGLVLGAMLGVGVAFLREYLDDSVHTREDLLQATGGVPVMGLIPRIHVESGRNGSAAGRPGRTLRIGDHLMTGGDPRSWASEAYRGLRTNITFANPDEPPNTLVITSPLPRDGKSTTATNLAITLAQLGRRALLVDADMRCGCLHDVFDVPQNPGLSEILTGESLSSEAIHAIDLEEGGTLFVLPTGTFPPNPTELLSSSRMTALLKSVKAQFDSVILDCPPLMAVTDAAILGTYADGTLLVTRANVTEKGAIKHCIEQLRQVRAPVLGIILNDVDPKRDGRYGEPYGMYEAYGYGHNGNGNGNGARRASDKRWGASRPPQPQNGGAP